MRKILFVLLPVFYSATSLAASPVQIEASAGLSLDDNITRAELDSDIEKDTIISVDVEAAYRLPINDISYASLKASLDVNQYQDFDKLSNTILGLQATYHIKPSAGYTAIRYFVMAKYEQRMVDSDQRDGSAIDLRLGLSKRLTDLISMGLGINKEAVDVDEINNVFDTDSTELYISFDYRLTDNNTLYTTVSSIDGDVVVTASPAPKLYNYTNLIVQDDAFSSLTPSRYAYRLNADTTTLSLGNAYAIDSAQAIDASVFYYSSSAYGGNDYSGTIFSLNYIYRF